MRYLLLTALAFFCFNAPAQDNGVTPDKIRKMISMSVTGLHVKPDSIFSVSDSLVENGSQQIKLRIYRPAPGQLPVVYFIHGGAWIAGDLETHDNVCRLLSNRLLAIVVAVDYRRPPEALFPAAADDADFILRWVGKHQKTLGGNGKIVLIGDSAGGNLVASVSAENAKAKKPVPVAGQVLINPALDVRKGSATDKRYGMFVKMGIRTNADRDNPRLSPLAATDFSKLPPTFIVVGAVDEIRADGEAYFQKLQAAAVPAEIFVQPKMGHLSDFFSAAHPQAMPAIDFAVASVKNVLKQ